MISVIVPAYNEERFISKCLQSLMEQTLEKKDYEIIVSDSSSNDNTVEIAKEFADRVVVCKKVSAGFGKNYGAKFANGKILAFIDADSTASKTWLEGVTNGLNGAIAATGPVRALEKNPGITISLFYKWWSFQSRLTTKMNYPFFPGFNMAIYKDVFKKVGGFTNKNIVTDDIGISLKLRSLGKIKYSPKMLVYTSSRRIKERGILRNILIGLNFTLLKKSEPWQKHRKDY